MTPSRALIGLLVLAIAVLRPMLRKHHKANNDAAVPSLALAHA